MGALLRQVHILESAQAHTGSWPSRPGGASQALGDAPASWERVVRPQHRGSVPSRNLPSHPTLGSFLHQLTNTRPRALGGKRLGPPVGGEGQEGPGSDGSPNSTAECHQGPVPHIRAVSAWTLITGHVMSPESGPPTRLGPDPQAAEPSGHTQPGFLRLGSSPAPQPMSGTAPRDRTFLWSCRGGRLHAGHSRQARSGSPGF